MAHELVKVHTDAGVFKAVMIYWWCADNKTFRALICLLTDKAAIEYARRCQWEKRNYL